MLGLPSYYGTEWYDKESDQLRDEAPEDMRGEYRFYHASEYRTDKRDKMMVAQYTDGNGVDYVIDDKGTILYEGLIDKNRYPNEYDL